MDSLEILKSALGKFFKYNHYVEGVLKLRESLKTEKYYKDRWNDVIELIVYRKLQQGVPLYLTDVSANLPINENTDEEAYVWLTLMIVNSVSDQEIIEYK